MGYSVDDQEIKDDMRRIMKTGVLYYVSSESGTIMGIMSGLSYRVFWTNEKVASEHWFFVAPQFQRKGIGKILEQAFRVWAKVHGCDSVIITPNRYGSTDPKGVSEYLEKQGYQLHGYKMKRSLEDVRISDNANH